MAHTTYTVNLAWGEQLRFAANLSQASAPIQIEHDDGNFVSTPYQTADARHSKEDAAELLLAYLGHSFWGDGSLPDYNEKGEAVYGPDELTEEDYIRDQIVSVEAEDE